MSSRGAEERRSAAPVLAPNLEVSLPARIARRRISILAAAFVSLGLLTIPWLGPSYRFLSILISTEIAAIALYGLSVLFGQGGMLRSLKPR